MIKSSIIQPLMDALCDFQNALTIEQKLHLSQLNSVPTTDEVIAFTARVDRENSERNSRCVASRLCGVLDSVQQFSSVLDTFASSNPIAGLVWGSLKLTILVS